MSQAGCGFPAAFNSNLRSNATESRSFLEKLLNIEFGELFNTETLGLESALLCCTVNKIGSTQNTTSSLFTDQVFLHFFSKQITFCVPWQSDKALTGD